MITRKKRFGYVVLDRELVRDASSRKRKITQWTFMAKRLRGIVGYGITTIPFAVDVEDRAQFDELTIMVRSNSGFINGGTSEKDRHSGIQWKANDAIICSFDHKIGTFKMKKVSSDGRKSAVIEKSVIEGMKFYPFVAFSDLSELANGDQIEFIYNYHYYY